MKTKNRVIAVALFIAGAAALFYVLAKYDNKVAPGRALTTIQATPTPTPPQISMTQEALDKMIAEAVAKTQPKPTPQPAYTPDATILANVSEEGKMREGYVLLDQDGKKFMRIYRKDNHPITEGLTPDSIAIETWKQPIYTSMGDGTWDIVFKERSPDEIKPKQTPAPVVTDKP